MEEFWKITRDSYWSKDQLRRVGTITGHILRRSNRSYLRHALLRYLQQDSATPFALSHSLRSVLDLAPACWNFCSHISRWKSIPLYSWISGICLFPYRTLLLEVKYGIQNRLRTESFARSTQFWYLVFLWIILSTKQRQQCRILSQHEYHLRFIYHVTFYWFSWMYIHWIQSIFFQDSKVGTFKNGVELEFYWSRFMVTIKLTDKYQLFSPSLQPWYGVPLLFHFKMFQFTFGPPWFLIAFSPRWDWWNPGYFVPGVSCTSHLYPWFLSRSFCTRP